MFALTVILALVITSDAGAQNDPSDKVVGGSCESEIAGISNALNDFAKNAAPGSYLMIIGGSMRGEKSAYNSRRLEQLIEYITWGGKNPSDRIVTATGTPAKDGGYLRFYVNGIFSTEIRMRKNAKLCWGDGTEIDFKRRNQ